MASALGFLSSLLALIVLLVKEYLSRSSDAAKAQQKYVVDEAEFNALASAVLTRQRLKAATESSQARAVEDQVEASRKEREKNP